MSDLYKCRRLQDRSRSNVGNVAPSLIASYSTSPRPKCLVAPRRFIAQGTGTGDKSYQKEGRVWHCLPQSRAGTVSANVCLLILGFRLPPPNQYLHDRARTECWRHLQLKSVPSVFKYLHTFLCRLRDQMRVHWCNFTQFNFAERGHCW